MYNAAEWVNATLRNIKDGGVWIVPRSGTKVTVVRGNLKTCIYEEGFASDLSIPKVLKAAGWTFVEKGGQS